MKYTNQNIRQFWQEHGVIISLSFFILIMATFFRQSLYGIFGEQNYLSVHIIMEFFIITIAFTIAIQSWMVFPHILSSYRLWIGALFFAIGFLEIAHALTYKGMPFFLSESSAYKATWFFMVARLTEVIAMLAIILSKDRLVASQERWMAYGLALIYSFVWFIAIFWPAPLLPELVQEGIGTTTIKNNLQYVGMVVEFLLIFYVMVQFRSKEIFSFMLIVASVYLTTADYFFTTYKSVYDINNFTGHWFQLAGFYFLQRAVYHTSVEEPFQKQKEAEEQLKQSERFLQEITSHMGEGLVVMDTKGRLTYMNLEAERLLQWSQEDLLGKNIHDLIHRKQDGSLFPYEECPCKKSCELGQVFRIKEDWFIRKSGGLFPVSYVATPFFENGEISGTIMVFQDISQQKKDQELIQYMAFHDELTTLPNLRYVKDKMIEMLQQQPLQKFALLVLDIDRFKNMNEALGHSFGDLILQAVAARLQDQLSSRMFFGRLTGDEFALILSNVKLEEEILTVVERIQNTMKEPLQSQNLLLNITLSMGVAIYPDHGMDVEDLLQHANMALIEAQQQNKPYQLYKSSMDGKALDRLVLENDLYHALTKEEFHVVYQPQVDIQTGQIFGLEALVRWRHPLHGWISPAKFIPIAEETGLIIPLGEWVLRTACQQMKKWHNMGLPPMVIAVNLSIRQFYQLNLVETVKGILQETGLSPQFLELEITESMMMNVEHAMKTLHSLKQLGIHIAIDDFGTGYSSLSYLKHLPVDRLKIDQSFVRDLLDDQHDTTIVSTIISMARHLNLNVIAEGVETLNQKEVLREKQCQQVQGYLFSPPLTPEDLIQQFAYLQQKARESVIVMDSQVSHIS